MKTPWQFLIQKDGETVWSDLTTSAQISEGNYRLAAKNLPSRLEIDICLTRIPLDSSAESPQKQRHTRCVNTQGFLLLLPLTHLESGQWQIRCVPSVHAAMSGAQEQAVLNFEIIPNEMPIVDVEMPFKAPLFKPFLEMQLPEISPVPDFHFEPHHFHQINEEAVARLTPELEALSHHHYPSLEQTLPPLMVETEIIESLEMPLVEVVKTPVFSLDLAAESQDTVNEQKHSDDSLISPPENEQKDSDDILVTTPEIVETTPEKAEVLALVSQADDLELANTLEVSSPSQKREMNYLVQVHYLDSNTSITIDVVVIEDPEQPLCHLDLPNPAMMPRKLYCPLPVKSQVLPPKLPKFSHSASSKIRFSKFEPIQQVS